MNQVNEHISKQEEVSASGKSVKPAKPAGEVMNPALICGAVGAVLTIILSLVNRYDGIDTALKSFYMSDPFYMVESNGIHKAWDWLLVVVLSFGISFAVLDIDKVWRRVMIILLGSVVILLSSPVLMLWDVFWSPVTVFIGVFWSWMCSFIYSCQHVMPCELLILKVNKEQQKPLEKIVSSDPEHSDSEAKYQPKD